MFKASSIQLILILVLTAACSGSKHQEVSKNSEEEQPTSVKTDTPDPLQAESYFTLSSRAGRQKFSTSTARAEEVNGSLNINLNLEGSSAFQINGIRGLKEQTGNATDFQMVLLNFTSAPHKALSSQSENNVVGRIIPNFQGGSGVSVSVQGKLIKAGADTLFVDALIKDLKIEKSELIPE